MISTRYAPVVLCLLALALIPTLLHSYVGYTVQDSRRLEAIGPTLAGLSSQPTSRRAESVQRIFRAEEWLERSYRKPDGSEIRLFVARSHDHKRLYHHPENALARGVDLRSDGRHALPGDPEVPVFVLRGADRGGLVLYSLLYSGRFIENPIRFQLRTAGELLFSGRRDMILFFALDASEPHHTPVEAATATMVLREAIDRFLDQAATASE
jgi:hypothetical protein